MTDKHKVYSKVKQMLKKMSPSTDQNQLVVLSMLIAGIISGQKAQLSEIGLHIPHPAQPASLTKRFQRFVKNKRVNKTTLFLPFAQQILTHLATHPLFLTMDASQVGRGCMTLVVAVIYRQRAIPLVWIVYKGKKGHTTADRHIEVLQLLKALLPAQAQVILLGDAEYDTVEMLTWVKQETDWRFVVRTDPRIQLTELGVQYPFSNLLRGRYGCVAVASVLFTRQAYGPVMAVATWQRPHKRPIYLISNHECLKDICRFYHKRFKVETLFSDQKSRGFNIHKSHLRHPERVAVLMVAVSLAYMWMVYLGSEVTDDEKKRKLIDRSNRTDKSLFRLGLDWLKYVLTRGLDFNVLFQPPELPISMGIQ